MRDAAVIAAEVAAKYGCAVSPDVVKIVPMGQISAPQYRWCAKSKQLVLVDDTGAALGRDGLLAMIKARASRDVAARKAADPVVAARREKVREMAASGLTVAEIADALALPIFTIRSDFTKMKLGRPAFRDVGPDMDGRIMDLVRRGFSLNQIAGHMKLRQGQLRDHLVGRLGQVQFASKGSAKAQKKVAVQAVIAREGKRPKASRSGVAKGVCTSTARAEAAAARMARAVELTSKGMTAAQIAVELDIHVTAVYRALRRSESLPVSSYAQVRAERLAKIAQLEAEGLRVGQICEVMGLSYRAIYDLRRSAAGAQSNLKTMTRAECLAAAATRRSDIWVLLDQGLSQRQVADRLNVSHAAVYRAAKLRLAVDSGPSVGLNMARAA
jgi:DNA-binding NarL/FixJ family response regulator